MAKILNYAPGLFSVFRTSSPKIGIRYKVHYNTTGTYVVPNKSKIEPIVLGLDSSGVWKMLNYIHVFEHDNITNQFSDKELQFTVDGNGYEMFQLSFPTSSTVLSISILSDSLVEFVKPNKCDFVFLGSSVAQDNYATNHMNICPYMYRKYGVNCATLGVSSYHSLTFDELVKMLSQIDTPCIMMDILHICAERYGVQRKKIKKLFEFPLFYGRKDEVKILDEFLGGDRNRILSLSGDCMWDSVHINDIGTVEYCTWLSSKIGLSYKKW